MGPGNMRENHGIHHRLFDDEQEDRIKEQIWNDYVATGQLFAFIALQTLAMKFWKNLGNDPGELGCYDRFIADFKRRSGFSSRGFHTGRRNPTGESEDIDAWIERVRDLIGSRESTGTLETGWRVLPSGLLTWAPVA
jgi:hypothetical protein